MPKSGTPYLFELVKSLTSSEKRYCTLFLARNSSGKETVLHSLFNALDRQDSYSDVALLKAVPELDRRKLPNVKRRLYGRLLQALRLYYAAENTSSVIREHLQSAEILYQKGLFESCWKLLEKCKSLAYQRELIHMLPEIINWQKRRLVLRIRSANSRELYKSVMQEEQEVHQILVRTLAAEELNSRLYAAFITTGRVSRRSKIEGSDFSTLQAELQLQEAVYVRGETSFWEGAYINRAACQYYQLSGQFDRAGELARQRLDAFDSSGFMLSDEPVMYSYALNNYIICQLVLGNYSAAGEHLVLLREFGRNASNSPTAPSSVSVFETANFLELEMHIRRGTFDAALGLVQEISPELAAYDKSMHNVNVFSKYYRIALAYFGAGKFDESLVWVNRICNEGEVVSRADIYISVRMLNLLLQFEMQQYELLEYLADSYRRDFQRLGHLHASEALILQYFKRIPGFVSHSEILKALRVLLTGLEEVRREDHLETYAFAYFNLCDWLRAKLNGNTYARQIQDKKRLEFDDRKL